MQFYRTRTSIVASVLTAAAIVFVSQGVEAFCGEPNVLIVLDRSGSMNSANKWTQAKTAINTVMSNKTLKVRYGLVTFSDTAAVNAKLPSPPSSIQSALNSISPLGQTFMVKAMGTARTHLLQSLQADASPDRPTQILFLTDGEPSDRCPSAEVSQLRKTLVQGQTVDIRTYVIGFGALVNRVCLNDMANRGGTALPGSIQYYVANNANDLVSALQKIITDASNNARKEVCDNKDNDCDGKVDEYITRSCSNQGCQGKQTCSKGTWGACSAPAPQPEVCDNKDNDCDGKIDEGISQSCSNTCGTGQQTCSRGKWGSCNARDERTCTYKCATGKQVCSNDQWGSCSAKPSTEVCDGKDNDCDGKTDEDLRRDCLPCGEQTCQGGKWGSCVKGTPSPEICDNKDNDCDGKVDNFYRPCTNNCGTGKEYCSGGRWRGCDAKSEKACTNTCGTGKQTCSKDKWSSCSARSERTCTYKCATGKQVCSNDKWGSCSAKPSTEVCDGKDNDCDGKVDESITRSCGPCGTQTCNAGQWGVCNKTKPSPEVCDNKDNDCDGKTDEGLEQPCKKGSCTGKQTCSRGKWSPCKMPAEVCDGKDNDCDGKVDENWSQKGKPCGSGVGICYRTGVFVCKPDGSGVTCNVPPGKPEQEVCDARDNDCDGKSDEDLQRNCTTECGGGTQVCKEGSWTACVHKQGKTAKPESCNGLDDDCDGMVDNGIARPCQTACGEGVQQCLQGDWSTCSAPFPKPEVCNGKDDDCDGESDEDLAEGSCDKGFKCMQGACRSKCRNGECPAGQRCMEGYCVGPTCAGVRCSKGYACEKGVCQPDGSEEPNNPGNNPGNPGNNPNNPGNKGENTTSSEATAVDGGSLPGTSPDGGSTDKGMGLSQNPNNPLGSPNTPAGCGCSTQPQRIPSFVWLLLILALPLVTRRQNAPPT
ncbi:MAG: VWA domain-containing protein [Deltaproteobacteria bacterium]|nr:MAG: VWA domain-containing protein [Deltaproteobacteria bacterium]